MGFLRWIKRELDSSKRRQSAPPLQYNNGFDPNLSRDDAYLRALAKFNEFRTKKPSLSRRLQKKKKQRKVPSMILEENEKDFRPYSHSNRNYKYSAAAYENKNFTSLSNSPNIIGYSRMNDDITNHYEEFNSNHAIEQTAEIDSTETDDTKCFNLSNRHSFPINSHKTKRISRKEEKRKSGVIYENEVTSFEKNYCHNPIMNTNVRSPDSDFGSMSSPPVKFYKGNSSPFQVSQTPDRNPKHVSIYATSKKKDQYKVATNKNNSLNYPSLKLSQLPSYQTIVNKHGELVEYALPYNEPIDYQGTKFIEKIGCSSFQQYQDLIDDNFQFLNNERSHLMSGLSSNSASQVFNRRANYVGEESKTNQLLITDLDKSDGSKFYTNNSIKTSLKEIDELMDDLKNWSLNIDAKDRNEQFDNNRPLALESRTISGVTLCCPDEIQPSFTSLKKSSSLFFSAGTFRGTRITARNYEYTSNGSSYDALLRDLEILRKIRHPNVILLMAVCVDNSNAVKSLIFEPFKSTLNQLIHENDTDITVANCIDYSLQVINATIYIQKCGYIHSNISSCNILVSESKNRVKLSSFEVATCVNDPSKKEILKECGITSDDCCQLADDEKITRKFKAFLSNDKKWNGNGMIESLPKKYLPYSTSHRQLYAQHVYQPPELLSSRSLFVFPLKQSDVYNITLLIWEMLNLYTPFAIFSRTELEKLFSVGLAQLPTFEAERCQGFHEIFRSGLALNPSSRIQSVTLLKNMILNVKRCIESANQNKQLPVQAEDQTHLKRSTPPYDPKNSSSIVEFAKLLSPKTCGKVVYERTSTVKRRQPENGRQKKQSVKGLFQTGPDGEKSASVPPPKPERKSIARSRENVCELPNSINTSKPYNFEIDKISLPDTPIARKNKLRRTAWLTNKTLSPDEKQQVPNVNPSPAIFEDTTEQLPKHLIMPKKQLVNVKIKFIHNRVEYNAKYHAGEVVANKRCERPSNKTCPNISSQIDFWNSVSQFTTPNETNDIEVSPKELEMEKSIPPSQQQEETGCANGNDNVREEVPITLMEENNSKPKYYPNMPEMLSETFKKRSRRSNTDENFEDNLWRREKQRCEQSVTSPRRSLVRDAISIFEKITSTKPKNVLQKIENGIQEEKRSIDSKCEDMKKSPKKLDSQQTPLNPETSISKLNVTLSYNLEDCNKFKAAIPKSKTDVHTVSTEQNMSPTSSVAATKALCTFKRKSRLFSDFRKRQQQLKCTRRASDLGYFPKTIVRCDTSSTRHSMGRLEMHKTVGKMTLVTKENDEVTNKCEEVDSCQQIENIGISNIKRMDDVICWNCGSDVFMVNGREGETEKKRPLILKNVSNSALLTDTAATSIRDSEASIFFRRGRLSSFQGGRSTEDIYIDDDFTNQEEICFGRGNDCSDIMEILDFDTFSTDEIKENIGEQQSIENLAEFNPA